MIFIYIGLIVISTLPLVFFLIKRKRYRKVLTEGVLASAEIKSVERRRTSKGGHFDIVTFWYLPNAANQYQAGYYMTSPGRHRSGEKIDIYYLPQQPEKYAVPGSKYENWVILVLLIFIAFVLFACYKIDEMVGDQNITFNP